MTRKVLFSLLTLACAPDLDPSAEDEMQWALPTVGFYVERTLVSPGESTVLTAHVPPEVPIGRRVFFVMSDPNGDSNPCPPELGGNCLDLNGPWRLAGSARTIAGSHGDATASIPWTTPSNASHFVLQAVVFQQTWGHTSRTDYILVTSPTPGPGEYCDNASHSCATGLTCCARGGLPDSELVCMGTSLPGDCPAFP